MAHKKAAGSAKNLRDSNPKYRGVKVFGWQTVTAGDVIIRQKGDKYKLGANVYKGRDFTIHASVDGVVSFGKKKYTRFDGKIYLRTYVEVLSHMESITRVEKNPTPAKKNPNNLSEDLSTLTIKDLKEKAKDMGLKGYSTLKKAELIELISNA